MILPKLSQIYQQQQWIPKLNTGTVKNGTVEQGGIKSYSANGKINGRLV